MRYWTPGCDPMPVPETHCARVYVLGPPRDLKLLKKSDPSARKSEVYELAGMTGEGLGFLAAIAASPDAASPAGAPFDKRYRISEADAWADDFFGEHYGFDGEDDMGWRRIEHDWMGAASALALALDSHTNNTSLALAFELDPSNRVLLFPGDAQVGNWLSWSGRVWQVKNGSETRKVTTDDLLARTVLYKIGHHGSHNATLREQGLELMTSRELAAMLPVDRETAKKMEWNMPFPTLYRRIAQKAGGRVLDLEKGLVPPSPDATDEHEWERFTSRTSVTPDWIDYQVEC